MLFNEMEMSDNAQFSARDRYRFELEALEPWN